MRRIRFVIGLILGTLLYSSSHAMEEFKFARNDGIDASQFPRPELHVITHVSYNVCAGGKGFEIFDTKINATEDERHTWSTRSYFMNLFLKESVADIYSFQELSAQQVVDIQTSLGENYKFVVLASHPSDVEAGTIRNTNENLE